MLKQKIVLVMITVFTLLSECSGSDGNLTEPVNVAKAFVQALINNDRETAENLLGGDTKLINFVYGDPKVTENAKWYYGHIASWEQSYFQSSAATVKIHIKTETQEIDGGFDLMRADGKKMWLIHALY